MGRVYAERLGDARSAAVCHQNAFLLDPAYKPNLESARRLFAGVGEHDKALALHRREAALLADPAARAESLRAQAAVLESLGRGAEARQAIEEALALAPDQLRLLNHAALAAKRQGDAASATRLFMRAAGASADAVFQARVLRSAVLLAEQGPELGTLREEALRRLRQADVADPLAFHAMLESARAGNDWETVLRLCQEKAERTGSAADRAVVAAVSTWRLGRGPGDLAEPQGSGDALADDPADAAAAALQARRLAERDPAAASERFRGAGRVAADSLFR